MLKKSTLIPCGTSLALKIFGLNMDSGQN